MKKIYFSLFFLPGLAILSAQETKTLWQKDIPSSTQDFLTGMTSTIDRQILLSGSSIASPNPSKGEGLATGSSPKKTYDYHIIKLDQQGNKLWEKYFGGTRHDYQMSAISTREGGFLLAGTSWSNQSGGKIENNVGGSDVWLIRLDENGEELWQKTLGTKSNDEASSIVQTIDEGFFVTGNINSHKNLFGSKDVFVSKIDKNGNLLQTTIIGGKGLEEVQEIIATEDGGSLMLVYSNSGQIESVKSGEIPNLKTGFGGENRSANNNGQNNQKTHENRGADLLSTKTTETNSGKNPAIDNDKASTFSHQPTATNKQLNDGDYLIIKLDKNANVEWQKTYGGSEDDRPKTLVLTNQGYLIGGESRSNSSGNKKENVKEGTDLWFVALDKQGNELWQKSYNFGKRDVLMSLNTIRKPNKENFSEDHGFLIGGYKQAEGKIEKDDEKFWMLYINTEGKEEWRKFVKGKSRKKEERLVSAKLQSDGTFLLAGTSAEQLGEENWKILKLGDKQLEDLIEKQDIRIYPNPVEDYAYVEIGKSLFDENSKNGEAEIYIHDMSGRQIQMIKTKNMVTKINTSSLVQGVYVVTVKVAGRVVNGKIVKK